MPDRSDPPPTVSWAPDVVSVNEVVRGLTAGDRIGIYRVVSAIGAGGMGVVYRASDDRLGRDVAIKLVHAERRSVGKTQLLIEAQAMAKLSHPNVVTVYEVGIFGEELFVVMELVAGHTLRAWLAEARRPWREILHTFLEAGRGLAAAHEAMVLHGDFKPDNVLCGTDGRVRVTDFGLAASLEPPADDEGNPRRAAPGTPVYMAPELFAGVHPDARADQFSFCVALWEALAGKRPFAGDTLEELRRSVAAGVRGTLREVPPWLSRAVSRGLRVHREERYPTMAELLHDLARDPSRTRRRLAFAGMALVAAAGAVAFGVSRVEPCGGAQAHLAGVWDAGVRAAMGRSFQATGVPFAADAYPRVAAELDAWTQGWADMHRAACEATVERKEQSEALLDLRMTCLGERLGQVRALTGVLAEPISVETAEQATDAVRRLPDLSECAEAARLKERTPPSRDASVLELRARLDHVEALYSLSRHREALAEVQPLAEQAQTTAYPPIRARALIAEAEILYRLGQDLPRAEADLREAIKIGAAARMDAPVARAWMTLMWVLGSAGREEEALALRTAAEAAVAHAGASPLLRAGLAEVLGSLRRRAGHFDEALAELGRALELMESAYGPESARLQPILIDMGGIFLAGGRYAEALPYLERAVAIRDKMSESDPLETGEPRLALARALWETGDRPRARKLAEEARVAFIAAGPRAAIQRGEAEDWLSRAR